MLARAYLQCKDAFEAADEAKSRAINDLDGLWTSVDSITASIGERHPARPGAEYHQFCHFLADFFCSRGRAGGVLRVGNFCLE